VAKQPAPEIFAGLPVVTAERMRRLDELATAKYGIPAPTLMENAGRAVAQESLRWLKDKGVEPAQARLVVCCGRGANGGDGLAAARFLKEAGVGVSVYLCPPRKESGREGDYPELVKINLEKARAAGVPIHQAGEQAGLGAALENADAALDALLGTGSSGKPAGAVHHMIRELTLSKKPVLAVDLPSGLHPDTGHHSGVYVTAAATFTLGLAKRGLLVPHAKRYVGELKVLDIGYPLELFREG
jgi:NAD(P)H-hydrate epimerase